MASGSVLEEVQDYSVSYQKQLKLTFLIKQKQRYQQLVNQLKNNNKVMRDVIKQMANEQRDQIQTLINQNNNLQKQKLQMFQKQEKIIAQSFIYEQIMLENDNEFRQLVKNYEEKIIQLRRLVQMKQGAIQQFQSKKKLLQNMQQILIPPYNVTMHFYAQFQQYKKTISTYVEDHKALKKQNQKLINQNQTLAQKVRKMTDIADSKCSFLQYRNLINNQRYNTLPRKETKVHVTSLPKKISLKRVEQSFKNYGQKTRDISMYQQSNKLVTVKRILKKQLMQNESLKGKLRSLNKLYSQEVHKSKKITESNRLYVRDRQNIANQMNYYKNICKNYTETFLQRRKFPKSSSVEKGENIKVSQVNKVLAIKNQYNKKNLWGRVKLQLDQKCRRPIFPFIGNKKGRSLSSTIDYTKRQYQIISTEIIQKPIKVDLKSNIKQVEKKENQLMDSQIIFGDISIITGSKKTYFDIKKQQKKKKEKVKEEEQFDNFLNDSLFDKV